jgi:hypothetical protein
VELPYYPLSYHENPEELRREARSRGLEFLKATARCTQGAGQMFRYDGVAYADQRNALLKKERDEQPILVRIFTCAH